MRCLLLVLSCVVIAACGSGAYVPSDRHSGYANRGETNGRRFDFVSNKPEQDDWQIRVTGNSMWVGYAREAKTDRLGSITLTEKESDRLWELVEALNIPSRKQGTKDEDEGYVSVQIKEPAGNGVPSELHQKYISRASNDKNLIALARYLQDLTEKYKRERPNF